MTSLLEFVLRSTLVLSLGLGALLLLGKASSLSKVWTARAVLLCLVGLPILILAGAKVGLPILPAPRPAATLEATASESALELVDPAVFAGAADPLQVSYTPEAAPAPASFDWSIVGWAVLGAVAVWRLAASGRTWRRLWSLWRTSAELDGPESRELKDAIAAVGGPTQAPAKKGGKQSPLVFGCPAKVLLPRDFSAWPKESRTIALRHEAAHLKHNDAFWAAAFSAASALYCWHPLYHLLEKEHRAATEAAADQAAIASGVVPLDYAYGLVAIARALSGNPVMSPGQSCQLFGETMLEKRIRNVVISGGRAPRRKLWAECLAVAAFLAAAVGAFAQSGGEAPPIKEETKTIIVEGKEGKPIVIKEENVKGKKIQIVRSSKKNKKGEQEYFIRVDEPKGSVREMKDGVIRIEGKDGKQYIIVKSAKASGKKGKKARKAGKGSVEHTIIIDGHELHEKVSGEANGVFVISPDDLEGRAAAIELHGQQLKLQEEDLAKALKDAQLNGEAIKVEGRLLEGAIKEARIAHGQAIKLGRDQLAKALAEAREAQGQLLKLKISDEELAKIRKDAIEVKGQMLREFDVDKAVKLRSLGQARGGDKQEVEIEIRRSMDEARKGLDEARAQIELHLKEIKDVKARDEARSEVLRAFALAEKKMAEHMAQSRRSLTLEPLTIRDDAKIEVRGFRTVPDGKPFKVESDRKVFRTLPDGKSPKLPKLPARTRALASEPATFVIERDIETRPGDGFGPETRKGTSNQKAPNAEAVTVTSDVVIVRDAPKPAITVRPTVRGARADQVVEVRVTEKDGKVIQEVITKDAPKPRTLSSTRKARAAKAPKAPRAPRASVVPRAAAAPKASEAPRAAVAPKASEAPRAAAAPKAPN